MQQIEDLQDEILRLKNEIIICEEWREVVFKQRIKWIESQIADILAYESEIQRNLKEDDLKTYGDRLRVNAENANVVVNDTKKIVSVDLQQFFERELVKVTKIQEAIQRIKSGDKFPFYVVWVNDGNQTLVEEHFRKMNELKWTS